MNKTELIDKLLHLGSTIEICNSTQTFKKAKEFAHTLLDEYLQAINDTHCCTELKDEETPTSKDAFIAGYKKRALMSGLKYDEVSELHAKTLYKCWNSFGVTNSLSKIEFQKLANDFLVQTEEENKTKPKVKVWQTKNNVPILHNSLNDFYRWLCKNYW